jgi:hypothetical protein
LDADALFVIRLILATNAAASVRSLKAITEFVC